MADPEIKAAVANELSSTPFACTELTQLSGGTANFVYRGVLSQPLADGTTTVIVKHTKDYVASNRAFKLDAKRCLTEESALRALNSMHSITTTNDGPGGQKYQITVKTPQLLHFNAATYTQVLEDLFDAVDLKTFLLSPGVTGNISEEWDRSIGRTLGVWLRYFHCWISEAARGDVARGFGENEEMRKLKFSINYDSLVAMVDTYPEVLEGSRAVFEKVRELAAAELDEGDTIGAIHGDFWSGNVLIPKSALTNPLPTTPLFITDWELAQKGTRALDLGQMIAELYMLKHFKDIDDGLWAIEGFAEGYQDLSEDLAFRTIMHVGVHLVFWGSTVPGWGTKEQVLDVVRQGRDLIIGAWEKDRTLFKKGIWACLFRN
ncbi:kinase-like domain-containing protein [Aspergillus californicus]